jgi:hypothetical protein
MNLYVLDAVVWIFGTRGHIPQHGDFPVGPNRPSLASNANRLMRFLAASVLAIALLSLVLWTAVWLALKLL